MWLTEAEIRGHADVKRDSNAMVHGLRSALAAAALIGGVVAALPAHAQFSESYKFLEAVRKKDGAKVTDALNEPGSQIVNTKDVTTGESGLHIVTARRDLTWMQFLVGHGANVNARDAKGTTPLVLAANLGFLEGVDFLITSGARKRCAGRSWNSPSRGISRPRPGLPGAAQT